MHVSNIVGRGVVGGRAELAPDSFVRVIRKSRVKALGKVFLNSDVLHSRVLNVFSAKQHRNCAFFHET